MKTLDLIDIYLTHALCHSSLLTSEWLGCSRCTTLYMLICSIVYLCLQACFLFCIMVLLMTALDSICGWSYLCSQSLAIAGLDSKWKMQKVKKNSVRMICGRISDLQKWSAYKESVPFLVECYGELIMWKQRETDVPINLDAGRQAYKQRLEVSQFDN